MAMSPLAHIVLYHCPRTRSSGVLTLLEELGADYELHVMNMKKGEQRQAAYLAINPMGKVPAITHDGAVVTEQGAIYQYLGDLYAHQGLAPQMGHALRGPYLRWLFFYGSSFEPALVDIAEKRTPAGVGMNPYGDVATMLKTLDDQLAQGPYILGEMFTTADILWASSLTWATAFGLIQPTETMKAYMQRVTSRPSFAKAQAKDAELAAALT
jgi:glutathione S-transferase